VLIYNMPSLLTWRRIRSLRRDLIFPFWCSTSPSRSAQSARQGRRRSPAMRAERPASVSHRVSPCPRRSRNALAERFRSRGSSHASSEPCGRARGVSAGPSPCRAPVRRPDLWIRQLHENLSDRRCADTRCVGLNLAAYISVRHGLTSQPDEKAPKQICPTYGNRAHLDSITGWSRGPAFSDDDCSRAYR
jgi:hypothetical protein